MDFRYTDPDRGFQRSSVKGVLGRLVGLKNEQHATALEVAAGGKLWQVLAASGHALLPIPSACIVPGSPTMQADAHAQAVALHGLLSLF